MSVESTDPNRMVLNLPTSGAAVTTEEWCQDRGAPAAAALHLADTGLVHDDPACEEVAFQNRCCRACVVDAEGKPAGNWWSLLRRFAKAAHDLDHLLRPAPVAVSGSARAALLGNAAETVYDSATWNWPPVLDGDPKHYRDAHAWVRSTFDELAAEVEVLLGSGDVFSWMGLEGEPGWLVVRTLDRALWSVQYSHAVVALRAACTTVASHDDMSVLAGPIPALDRLRLPGQELIRGEEVRPGDLELALSLYRPGGTSYAELLDAVWNAQE